jgi:low temperature requirement protein LtrA
VAILGLALSAALWWCYFSVDQEDVERAFSSTTGGDRAQLAIDAFGYWHLLLLLGVIVIAAAEKEAIGHAFATLDTAHAVGLAGGVAIFLLGIVLFRRSLHIGLGTWLTVAGVLALTTPLLGIWVAAAAELAGLVVLIGLAFAVETRLRTR